MAVTITFPPFPAGYDEKSLEKFRRKMEKIAKKAPELMIPGKGGYFDPQTKERGRSETS